MAQDDVNDDALVALIREIDAAWDQKTHQGAFYSPEGDCAFVYLEDAPYFAVRQDAVMTTFLALDNRRLVGFQIHNVSRLAQPAILELEKTTGEKAEIPLFVDELLLLTFKHPDVSKDTFQVFKEALGQARRSQNGLPLQNLAACK